ncbi:Hpt domain-containing protein [Arthrobacter rhizosphaerae]|uniref:Hpt domain-containing protein n=1 Tax=Arthrobacter rhizosphaerae TaxID=2855490 RepID=UPI001FF347AE|nr:Hpt domain-containing protein [Arthrobacter rhizosphaerae]
MAGIEPVLDGSCFRILAYELDGESIALRFITEFRNLLPSRMNRIQRAVGDQDLAAAMDAVLSLASSASMVGGLQVAHQCRTIGHAVKISDFVTAQRASLVLEGQTQALANELTAMLDARGCRFGGCSA